MRLMTAAEEHLISGLLWVAMATLRVMLPELRPLAGDQQRRMEACR
jgi:hypothetical protein